MVNVENIAAPIDYVLKFFDPGPHIYNAILFSDIKIICSCDIRQKLPASTELPHPVGIVISDTANIGKGVRIYQNVTIGWTLGTENQRAATIEDNVIIYSGATIIGDVNIGSEAVIGSNACVLEDVKPNTTVAGVPAKEI